MCSAKVGPDIIIPSLKTAVNIELGTSSIKNNIQKALDDFNLVIVCSDEQKTLDKISLDEDVITTLVWNAPMLFESLEDKER